MRPSCTDMNEAWQAIKVLLVPSVWHEAWGIVVIEAHLRGIPVVCSDAGALPEAMRGLAHTIPVKAINGERDANGVYFVPEQDFEPWARTLNELMNNKTSYENLAMEVREKTVQWLEDMDESALERWLLGLGSKMGKCAMIK
jgi:glycosyltransferase involved in cell wall biosynthesis